jgi:Flp pilus assembly protein TadG
LAPGIFRRTVARARSVRAFGRRFRAAQRGGVALLTALSLPPLVLVSLGAIQLQAVFTDRSKSQDIADAAAIWGAQQLTVTPVGVEDRTEAFAEAHLAAMQENATVTVVATKIGDTTMKVSVDTHRPSFFFNLMPAGGFYTHAEAVAEGVSQTPLCVVSFGLQSGDKIELTNASRLMAPECLVHGNKEVKVGGSALLQAETIQTGGNASGPMSPAASTGAPNLDDPFTALDILGPLACPSTLPKNEILATTTLAAGAHCQDIVASNGAVLTLAPGEHYFHKMLELKNGASLLGDDVVLIFGKDAETRLKEGSDIALSGRESGRLAGFVIVGTRNRTKDLKLEADHISALTGTIYVPKERLEILGDNPALQDSEWTVTVAKSLKMSNKPQVQINANYSGSEVPVPSGVGNSGGSTRLTQ